MPYESGSETKAAQSIEPILHELFETVENRDQRGIESGLFDLDDMLNGFQNSELIVVASRPSVGKTAFLLSVLRPRLR
jgi:replicative DNA helicase